MVDDLNVPDKQRSWDVQAGVDGAAGASRLHGVTLVYEKAGKKADSVS
jgi:hypothetical protein